MPHSRSELKNAPTAISASRRRVFIDLSSHIGFLNKVC